MVTIQEKVFGIELDEGFPFPQSVDDKLYAGTGPSMQSEGLQKPTFCAFRKLIASTEFQPELFESEHKFS